MSLPKMPKEEAQKLRAWLDTAELGQMRWGPGRSQTPPSKEHSARRADRDVARRHGDSDHSSTEVSVMNDETLVLSKHQAVKRHVLGLKEMSRTGTSTELPIAEIAISERLIPEDPRVVAQLVVSIQQTRQLTPILVRRSSAGSHTLIDGLNRIAALKCLGEMEVLATVLNVTSDEEAKACEAISNSHRRQKLSALDRALTDVAFLQYVEGKVSQDATPRGGKQPKEKFHAKTARELGVSPDQIARSCKIAKIVPYVQNAVRKCKQEDNQRLLLEVAASGEDVSAQFHTLTRLMGKVPEAAGELWTNRLPWPASLGADERAPFKSQMSADRISRGFEASGAGSPPSGDSIDNVPEAIPEGGGIENFARLAVQNTVRRKSAASERDEGQGGVDQADAKGRYEEGRDAKVGEQIQLNIPPDLRAKLVSLADSTAIRIIGFVRAPAGAPPSIEFQDITELREDESDWPE
jgi:hypothetical protein